ncbi:hypothetical protein ACQRXC_29495 (plasmid) [Niallia taxi]|uniref:hypothetical protein n=1 Tax=Niallia taxi TaxID=2499688 RepID=UPI003F620ECF
MKNLGISLVTSYEQQKRLTDILSNETFSLKDPRGSHLRKTSRSEFYFVLGRMGSGRTQLDKKYFENPKMFTEDLAL